MFADTPEAPFSIHQIVLAGAAQGNAAGSWLGPTSISQVLAVLVGRHASAASAPSAATRAVPCGNPAVPPTGCDASASGACSVDAPASRTADIAPAELTANPAESPTAEGQCASSRGASPAGSGADVTTATDAAPSTNDADAARAACDDTSGTAPSCAAPPLAVHVAMDGSVYRDRIVAAGTQPDGSWRAVLLLVPLRLGLDQINAEYAPCLRELFSLPQSLGIIGGRPRKSHYFIGCQGDRLLYLDPHEVQPALAHEAPAAATCHYARPLASTPLQDIDPSLALGFLCTSAADFDELCTSCEAMFARRLALFSISMAPPQWRDSGAIADNEGEAEAEAEDDLVVV